MSEQILPLGSRVLLQVLDAEAVTRPGLVIPDTAKEKPQRGRVMAVGDDLDGIKVTVGDIVLFAQYTGAEVRVDDADDLILGAGDILAVVGPAPVPAGAPQ